MLSLKGRGLRGRGPKGREPKGRGLWVGLWSWGGAYKLPYKLTNFAESIFKFFCTPKKKNFDEKTFFEKMIFHKKKKFFDDVLARSSELVALSS